MHPFLRLKITPYRVSRVLLLALAATLCHDGFSGFAAELDDTNRACATGIPGLASWWRMEGNVRDSVGTNHGTSNILSYATGKVNLAGEFTNFTYVVVSNSASLNPSGSFTIEAWVRPSTDHRGTILGKWAFTEDRNSQASYYLGTVPGGGLVFKIADADHQWDPEFHLLSAPGVLNTQVWQHVVAVYDQPLGRRVLYVNGTNVAERTHEPVHVLPTTCNVGIGANLPSPWGWEYLFQGHIDELSFYSVALTPEQIALLHSAGAAGKCLEVPSAPCDMLVEGATAWWCFETDTQDSMGITHGIPLNHPQLAPGMVGKALSFGGTNFVELPNVNTVSPSGSFTIEGWIYPHADDYQTIVAKWGITEDQFNQRSYSFGLLPDGGLQFAITDFGHQWDASFTTLTAAGVIQLHAWNHVAAVFDQPSGVRRLLVNGVQVAEMAQEPFFVFNSSAIPTIGAERNSSKSVSGWFNGLIDELAFYNRALSSGEIRAVWAAGATGKCVNTPIITRDPYGAMFPVGGEIALSVAAVPPPVGFQWRKDGVNVPGQTNASFRLPGATRADAGSYDVVVTFSSGATLTSRTAYISVMAPVTITRQPLAVAIADGAGFVLSASVEGDFVLYQWYKDGFPLYGAINSTYEVARASVFDTGTYQLLAQNELGAHWTEPANVRVFPLPVVSVYPERRTISEGGTASFYGSVQSSPDFWGWMKDGDIVAATNATLTIRDAKVSDAGTYSLVASNLAGAVSASVVLTVQETVYLHLYAETTLLNGKTNYVSDVPTHVSITSLYRNGHTYYTLDGSEPTFQSARYEAPFVISRGAILRVRTYDALYTESRASAPIQFLLVPKYSLTITNAGGGSVSVSPSGGSYYSNTVVTVHAVPAAGWSFLGWRGALSGTNWYTELGMNSDKTVEPVFGQSIHSVLTGKGVLVAEPPGPVYPYGTEVRFTAVPDPGYYLGIWGGSANGSANPISLTVTNTDLQLGGLIVELPPHRVALTVLPRGFGSVSRTPPSNLLEPGSTVTLLATPQPGQAFLGWEGDLAGAENPVSLVLSNSAVVYAKFSTAPTLNIAGPLAGFSPGGFTIGIQGEYRTRYWVQSTGDLSNWTSLGVVSNAFGFSQFLDAAGATNSIRVYRALKE